MMEAWMQFQDEILVLAAFCLVIGGVFGLFVGISIQIERKTK